MKWENTVAFHYFICQEFRVSASGISGSRFQIVHNTASGIVRRLGTQHHGPPKTPQEPIRPTWHLADSNREVGL